MISDSEWVGAAVKTFFIVIKRRRTSFFASYLTRIVPCLALSLTLPASPLVEFGLNLICQSCYMDFSKLLHGFVKINRWISLSCNVDLSKLLHGFVNVGTWTCLSCSMFDHNFKAC